MRKRNYLNIRKVVTRFDCSGKSRLLSGEKNVKNIYRTDSRIKHSWVRVKEYIHAHQHSDNVVNYCSVHNICKNMNLVST